MAAELSAPVDPARDHLRGSAEPAVTLVVYGDYECPYTRMAYHGVERALRELAAQLRFVFRHFPLTEIHPDAAGAALAAEAAAAQDRFWEMHDLLFHNQRLLDGGHLVAYAERAGLDLARFGSELRDGSHAARVEEDLRSGVASGVRGTPTLFVDGRGYAGPYEGDDLVAVLRHAAAGDGG
jgi:Na+:H+ antiporter, NhaA family